MRLKAILFALVFVGLLVGWIVLRGNSAAAPDSNFILLDGNSKKMSAMQGQVTLVNFWATSCASCVSEMPALVATYEKFHARGFSLVAVSMQYDPPNYVVNFAKSRDLPFDVAIDNSGAIAQEWGKVQLTPTTFVVNKRGAIVKRYVGVPDFAELHLLLEKLLRESA
jgi:peroxiredoxin